MLGGGFCFGRIWLDREENVMHVVLFRLHWCIKIVHYFSTALMLNMVTDLIFIMVTALILNMVTALILNMVIALILNMVIALILNMVTALIF